MSNAERIRELRAARGVAKRQLTIIERFITDMGPDVDLYIVEARFESLDPIRQHFEQAQVELERVDPTETLEPEDGQLTERESFENRYIQIKARLQKLLRESPHNSSFNPLHNSTVLEISTDFPKTELPDFHGEYAEFPTFMDLFDTLVHNNTSRQLSNVRRLGILMNSCKRRAFDVIKHLRLTNENYEVALKLLKERFENPRLNFEECVRALWDAPKATSAKSIRTLFDDLTSQMKALERLGSKEQMIDGILIHLVLSKLDNASRQKWEEHQASSKNIPSWPDFTKFLEKRCTVWEALENVKSSVRPEPSPTKSRGSDNVKRTYTTKSTTNVCMCEKRCKNILECDKFKDLAPKKKFLAAKDMELCYCCLRPRHDNPCEAPLCIHCNRLHHSQLHYGKYNRKFKNNNDIPIVIPHSTGSNTEGNVKSTLAVAVKTNDSDLEIVNNRTWKYFEDNYCFLATAVVLVKNFMGDFVPLRVLFDGAAQSPFITSRAANILQLEKIHTHLEMSGVHGSKKILKKAVKIQLKSAFSDFNGELFLPINPYFHDSHPAANINVSNWPLPRNIQLADPSFNLSAPVDILLDAHTTYEWQCMGQIKLGEDLPLLQKTLLGWVVVGNCKNYNTPPNTRSINVTLSGNLENMISRFWTIDELHSPSTVMTPEEIACEQHYLTHVKRKPDGRFVVKLPFKIDPTSLGDSFCMASHRFDALRRKLDKDDDLNQQYSNFMKEYRDLGHCKPAPSKRGYVIPHFHVLNPGSTTTKLRVVFDASAPSSSGFSLNDILMIGPTIQRDLFDHLINIRTRPIGMGADITKMYRQIEVDEEDRRFQQIIWEDDAGRKTNYELTTVTYGTGPGAFLATRPLKTLADEETEMLRGAEAIRNNMYVDDLLCGADTVEEAITLYKEVTAILAKGQFPIRKFCSNSDEVMSAIPTELHGTTTRIGDKDVVKTLGVLWEHKTDVFTFHYQDNDKPLTKRGITSEVSSLFDPLGLISPVVVLGKIIIQKLWSIKLDWDESLPQSEVTSWLKLRDELKHVEDITVPRYVLPHHNVKNITLHGFGDASKLAYAAAIYVRSEDEHGNVYVSLLCSKTRVAPLKKVTLPRLELLGGQLLAQLYYKVKPLLHFRIDQTYLWLDASIALTWIQASPHKWTDYVATRVTRIQELTVSCQWRHVRSEDNPADVASRGMLPSKLKQTDIWFNGPHFLRNPTEQWPNRFSSPEIIPEVATPARVLEVTVPVPDLVLRSKYQSWTSLKIVFGYVGRFISRLKSKFNQRNSNAPPSSIIRREAHERKSKPSVVGCPSNAFVPLLDANELDEGIKFMVKIIQRHHFSDIIDCLEKKKPLPRRRKEIVKLHPLLDEEGIIRVGGRLTNSTHLEYASKYPMLIPAHHPITRSLFIHIHAKFMHAGPGMMMNVVYQQFWPLRGKVVANSVYERCLRCSCVNPKPSSQLMGDLPRCRVSPADRAFASTGVDYFEPLYVSQPGRGRKPLRAYVCLFICMTTKAVHLELVDDLSTPGFLSAFQCFVSRRGTPAEMFSDNGRNFVGARNLLYENQQRYDDPSHWQAVYEWCRSEGIVWHFSPPRTPHFGGLWEAAVKSAKYHIIRAIGQTSLYRKEMEAVLCTVEAILNSRPLIPVTPHPEDGSPLTPAHFLVNGPLKTLPEPYLANCNLNNIERYKRVVAIRQIFWLKWSREYLQTLMNRYKWSQEKPNLKPGDYVLLVDKNTKPLMWQWGRIVTTTTARDGKVRSAQVKTTQGTYERGISELCLLPFDETPASV